MSSGHMPDPVYRVFYSGDGSWQRGKAKKHGYACALCGRAILKGEDFEGLSFRATMGIYMQAYHPLCARLRKTAGDKPVFRNRKRTWEIAERWACTGCPEHGKCSLNLFDCFTAIHTLCEKCLFLGLFDEGMEEVDE